MLSNKAALVAIGAVALVGASATGAFLASRQRRAGCSSATGSTASLDAAATPGVEATEGVVEDAVTPPPHRRPRPCGPPPGPCAGEAGQPPHLTDPATRGGIATERAGSAGRARPQPAAGRAGASGSRGPSTVRSAWPAGPRRPTERPVEPVPVTDMPITREERRPVDQAVSTPAAPQFEDVTVPADAVIGLQLESSLSSDTARVEDRVEARVTRDVRANGRVAIAAGSRVLGSVSVVERGGKMKERARLGVRFHTVILADGTELPLQTETVLREGEAPGNASAAKVGGGAIGGAILGAILGGGKGAAIGAGVGAGAGTAAVMAGGRRPAQIQAGSPMTVKVLSPVTVPVEK